MEEIPALTEDVASVVDLKVHALFPGGRAQALFVGKLVLDAGLFGVHTLTVRPISGIPLLGFAGLGWADKTFSQSCEETQHEL